MSNRRVSYEPMKANTIAAAEAELLDAKRNLALLKLWREDELPGWADLEKDIAAGERRLEQAQKALERAKQTR